MRKDGKFVGVDGSIPEGQGIVMAHLNECHELLEMVCLNVIWMVNMLIAARFLLQLKESMDDGDYEDDDDDDDGEVTTDEEDNGSYT
jgi:hypothetical protein